MGPKWTGFTSATDESEKSGCHSRAILRSDADLRTPPMNYELLKSRGFRLSFWTFWGVPILPGSGHPIKSVELSLIWKANCEKL